MHKLIAAVLLSLASLTTLPVAHDDAAFQGHDLPGVNILTTLPVAGDDAAASECTVICSLPVATSAD